MFKNCDKLHIIRLLDADDINSFVKYQYQVYLTFKLEWSLGNFQGSRLLLGQWHIFSLLEGKDPKVWSGQEVDSWWAESY